MDRLQREYNNEPINVLVINETQLLLLLEGRHVRHDKVSLTNWLRHSNLTTDLSVLRPSDVVRIVKPNVPDLYSTDIKEINLEGDEYTVTIHSHCLVYFGQFKIKLNKGI